MAIYNVQGWVWAGLNVTTTLLPVTLEDDDATMSPYYTNDFGETLTINGSTYTNPRGGAYELTFTDSDNDSHTEDFLLFNTGSNFVFIPMPGSQFDTGSDVDSLGGWQSWSTGLTWTDVVCFTRGVLIETPNGPRKIETLKAGDLVSTKAKGNQPIAWIGSSKVVFADLQPENAAKTRPIRICAGALGAGTPSRDLVVSQQHRILVTSKICLRMFGCTHALIAANRLLGLDGISIDFNCTEAEFFHLLLSQHEIVFSEGAASESLYLGPEALKSVPESARLEILELYPEIESAQTKPEPAAFIPPNKQQRKLVSRHLKNRKPLIDPDFAMPGKTPSTSNIIRPVFAQRY